MIRAAGLPTLCCVLLVVAHLPAAKQPHAARRPQRRAPPEGSPPPPLGEVAHNKTELVLMQDARKLFGWISGARSYVDRAVQIRLRQRTYHVRVDSENTFSWYHKIDRPALARVRIGDLRGAITLRPRPAGRPGGSLVVNRLVYRPGLVHRLALAPVEQGRAATGERALELRLDRSATMDSDERLTGVIRSRYRDAKVLLCVRDGDGIRAWRAFRLRGGALRLNLLRPAALGRRAVMTVRYVDRAGRIHVAAAPILGRRRAVAPVWV